ncbi:MAG: CcmD family protein [Planctomycetota bacterium]|jgi:CcmD family protein
MFYFCLAFSLLWLIIFAYVFTLDRQVKDIGRRLDARTSSSEQQ